MSSNLKVNTILPSSGTTVTVSGISSVTGSISAGSSITATTFYGSGANLTSLPSQLTLSNNADNRVITGGSGTNLNGEANLTFDGSNLQLLGQPVPSLTNGANNRIVTATGTAAMTGESNLTWDASALSIKGSGEGGPYVYRDGGNGPDIVLHGSRGTIASPTASAANDLVGNINFAGYDGSTYQRRASINGIIDGTVVDGSNTVPTALVFKTGTTAAQEKLRITSAGSVNIGGNYDQTSYTFSSRGAAVDQTAQFSNTKTGNNDIHYIGITLSNGGTGQALFGHSGHTTAGSQAAWMGLAGDDVAGGTGVKVFRGGTVLKTGQPYFMAGAGADSTSNGNYMVFTTEYVDVRGDYNNSTGIFTAPIAGRYLFTLTGLYTKNNSSATWKLTWHVNNANQGVAAEFQSSSLNNTYNTIGTSSIIYQLAENDTVRLKVDGSTFHISGGQTRYCGYLLG